VATGTYDEFEGVVDAPDTAVAEQTSNTAATATAFADGRAVRKLRVSLITFKSVVRKSIVFVWYGEERGRQRDEYAFDQL
jgi:hypothetical protein